MSEPNPEFKKKILEYLINIEEKINITEDEIAAFWTAYLNKKQPEFQEYLKIGKLYKLKKELIGISDWKTITEQIIKKKPIYYDKSCMWWIWNEERNCYEITDETDLCNLVDEVIKRNTLKSSIKSQIIEAFKRNARKNEPKQTPTSWVQFKDIIIDINTGERIPVDPKYFLTNPIPHKLGISKETPIIDALFKDWVGEYWITLKQILAYTMLRDYPLHRIFLLIGSGSNGKGTYLRLMNNLIGTENIASAEMDLLLNNQFHITKLHKKLACQMSETNFTALKNTSMLKRLSGGDLVGFEYKNKLPFDDYNYAKIVIATNSLPVTLDKTDGFYRRWVIIDFKNQYGEKNDVLLSITETEYENLCAWCAEELKEIITKREFYKEGDIKDRKERYETRSNPLKTFININYERNINSMIPANDFYNDFSSYLQNNGHRNLTYQVVRSMMKDEGFEYEKHRVMDNPNPISVVMGLIRRKNDENESEKGVPDVPAVPAFSVYPYTRRTNPKVAEQVEQLEQSSDNIDDFSKLREFLIKNPVNNAFDIEEQFDNTKINMWINKGLIIEMPYGTYRLL